MTPRAVLFDLGGVLLPFDPERRVAAVVERLGAAPGAVRELFAGDLPARMDLGEASLADFAAAFAALSGRRVTADEAQALLLSVFEAPNEPLWRLAAQLSAGRIVGAMSDNPVFVRAIFPADGRLDPVIFSAEIGATKPSDAAFAAAEARLGLAAADILLVDDGPTNIAAARQRGWDAILFRSNDELMVEFAARGLP